MKAVAVGIALLLLTGCSGFRFKAKDTFEIEFSIGNPCGGDTHTIIHEEEISIR
jgi:hypothetical protein